MARKNASILNMIHRTNRMLDAEMGHLMCEAEQKAYRRGVAAQLECVLHENGVYAGFGYTDKAGMVFGENDAGTVCVKVTDDTRRVYTVSSKLR